MMKVHVIQEQRNEPLVKRDLVFLSPWQLVHVQQCEGWNWSIRYDIPSGLILADLTDFQRTVHLSDP